MSDNRHTGLSIDTLVHDEAARLDAFPIARRKIFMGHAGVTVLPRVVADAIVAETRRVSEDDEGFDPVIRQTNRARIVSARFIGADPSEISLLGPTSLGLSLFANGIDWKPGDHVICYADDYPANVYPWLDLRRLGVEVTLLRPAEPGEITPELVASALTPRTRLVALASCHYLSGYRIDVDAIGRLVRERGILFSLDAIQTIGAFPLSVDQVDFLSADAHKWMLGPMAIGIVYVKKACFPLLRPTLLGAWNVASPDFIAQEEIVFPENGIRYEPGVLNTIPCEGMVAALELLSGYGMANVAARLLKLKAQIIDSLRPHGFQFYGPTEGPNASGITTFWHPEKSMAELFAKLEARGIIASLRHNRAGQEFIRLSPHFYNTEAEVEKVVETLI